ncbi:MAG: CBS domain-containing protein [Acidimicrobiia bacterium]|nr:CBS domain-containing protein [Acidimicrobiia bacterium]NNF68595.1 CBS domain-containing protein [Acidimicrobiia bacterium]
MKTVAQILQSKGGSVWTVDPDATVFEALSMMADKGVGALVVTDAGKLCGIISERDYARKVILLDRDSRETTVSEIMTSKVLVVSPATSTDECMALMTDKRIRHLPVLEGEDLLGLVSIGDIVRAKISEQQFIIDELERYITG